MKKYPGYAFPGGHVDEGESIYDSAVREIKEETGYDVTELKSCGFIYWESLNGDRYFTYFFKTSSFSGECIGETEEGPVCWVDPAELSKMKLALNMEKYMKMFSGSYSECYCLQDENGWQVEYK